MNPMSNQSTDPITRKDRRNGRIVGLGVVIIFALIAVVVVEGIINYQSQTNHHASTVKSDKQITQLLKEVKASQADHVQTLQEIKSLEKQVANVISGLPAADAQLARFAVWLEICVGQDHEWDCPAPPIPTSP